MFRRMIEKFNAAADHHQILCTVLVGLGLLLFSWGAERLLEKYFFPTQPVLGYSIAVVVGLFLLWFMKHVILHVI